MRKGGRKPFPSGPLRSPWTEQGHMPTGSQGCGKWLISDVSGKQCLPPSTVSYCQLIVTGFGTLLSRRDFFPCALGQPH